jgi:hypothetical protein
MAQREAALRQGTVDCIEAKRKNSLLRPATGFHPLQPAAQLGNSGGRAGQGHPQDLLKDIDVPILFFSVKESIRFSMPR